MIWLYNIYIWLVVEPTPLKNDGVKVSWDHEFPNIWVTIFKQIWVRQWEGLSHILWKNKINFQNHQPDIYIYIFIWLILFWQELDPTIKTRFESLLRSVGIFMARSYHHSRIRWLISLLRSKPLLNGFNGSFFLLKTNAGSKRSQENSSIDMLFALT